MKKQIIGMMCLAAMMSNGTSLQTLVDHLLYVQKIEAGMIKLRISHHCFIIKLLGNGD